MIIISFSIQAGGAGRGQTCHERIEQRVERGAGVFEDGIHHGINRTQLRVEVRRGQPQSGAEGGGVGFD